MPCRRLQSRAPSAAAAPGDACAGRAGHAVACSQLRHLCRHHQEPPLGHHAAAGRWQPGQDLCEVRRSRQSRTAADAHRPAEADRPRSSRSRELRRRRRPSTTTPRSISSASASSSKLASSRAMPTIRPLRPIRTPRATTSPTLPSPTRRSSSSPTTISARPLPASSATSPFILATTSLPTTLLTTVDENADLEAYIYIPTERATLVRQGLPVEILDTAGNVLVKSTDQLPLPAGRQRPAEHSRQGRDPAHRADFSATSNWSRRASPGAPHPRPSFLSLPSAASAARPSSTSRLPRATDTSPIRCRSRSEKLSATPIPFSADSNRATKSSSPACSFCRKVRRSSLWAKSDGFSHSCGVQSRLRTVFRFIPGPAAPARGHPCS